jgi:hypothetical protein
MALRSFNGFQRRSTQLRIERKSFREVKTSTNVDVRVLDAERTLAVTALTLAGVGGWVLSTTQARNTAPMNGTRIDALQIMTAAKDMPTDHFVDYSLV